MKDKKEFLKELAIYGLLALILYLFYKSFWVLLVLPAVIIVYRRINKKQLIKKRKEKLNLQFKDALISFSAALRAGYSMENAVVESYKEMKAMYGDSSLICIKLKAVINKTGLGEPLENALDEMAEKDGTEDMAEFASIFRIAKRTGGDMVEIIKKTSQDIAAKVEVKNEISVLVSAKRLEQNLMLLMPVAMILFIDFSSQGLLDPLYGNLTGIVIMTVCLGVYAAAYLVSRKIMNIEV